MLPLIRSVTAAFFLFAAAFLGVAADVAGPTADQLKQAESVFRDVYGKEYDKLSKAKLPTDKANFAKKLWDASKGSSDNVALARVLADKAAMLASLAEPAGLPILLEIKKSRLTDGKDRPEQLATVATVLEKMARYEKLDRRIKLGGEVVDIYREAADLSQDTGRYAEVTTYQNKAIAAAKAYLPPVQSLQTLRDIASDKAEYDAERKHDAESDRLSALIKANPADPKINQSMGLLSLRSGRTAEAVPYLRASGVDRLKQVGNLLAQSPATDPIKLGDALRAAAEEFPNDKTVFLGLARQQYEAALAKNPKGPDADRMRLLVKEWQSQGGRAGNVVSLVDENPGIADLLAKENGGAKVIWDTNSGYATPGSLSISSTSPGAPQHRHGLINGWKYFIAERPVPGEYRYLRFAVKMRGGTFANITFGSPDVAVSYAIGKPAVPPRTHAIADRPPTEWLVVTRDLEADAQTPFTLNVFKVETDGEVYLDGMYLARSIRDLNKFTPKPTTSTGK